MASGRVPKVIKIFMELQLSRRIKVGRKSTQTSFLKVTVIRSSWRIPKRSIRQQTTDLAESI